MELPLSFVDSIRKLLGAESDAFFAALQEAPPVSVRTNLLKGERQWDESIPWTSSGGYLKERPSFTFDPLFHAGCYYVQEASSMFVEQAFKKVKASFDEAALRVLDLCAAPGGKSTLLASMLSKDDLLVANEILRPRANILAENLIKWGLPNVVVTQSDPATFSNLPPSFDVILADVPCSGEGMFRKDPHAITEWSIDNVAICANRQREIIQAIWPTLHAGGFLMYSTCTYNTKENEENVQWICQELGGSLVEISTQEAWGISGAKGDFANGTDFPVYRFFPHLTKGEGFFLALIQKEEGSSRKQSNPKHDAKKKADQKNPTFKNELIRSWIKEFDAFTLYQNWQGGIAAIPKIQIDFFRKLEQHVRIVHAGIGMGVLKGKDVIPDAALALSVFLDPTQFNTYDLQLTQAIDFLKREAIVVPEGCPLGWVLITFQNHPLGWIKNLGSRANNNYPNEWRIRSDNPF